MADQRLDLGWHFAVAKKKDCYNLTRRIPADLFVTRTTPHMIKLLTRSQLRMGQAIAVELAIKTNEPPQGVWQKLKQYIDPSDYRVMLPLDARAFSPQDGKALKWILSHR